MQQFFKMLQKVAEGDEREFTDIKELTIELAMSSGYHRERKMKVDGVTPTAYTLSKYTKWNEPLVAKWLLYYKHLFISSLLKHKKLEPYYCYIISRVFQYVFQGLQIDKLKSGASVTSNVKRMLSLKIGEAFYELGTERRSNNLKAGEKKGIMRRSTMVHSATVSMDQMAEEHNIQFEDVGSCKENDFIFSLYNKFNVKLISKADYNKLTKNQQRQYQFSLYRSKLGKRLLNVMLNSTEKINPMKIADYLEFDPNEVNTEEKKLFTASTLEAAYKIIINELKHICLSIKNDLENNKIKETNNVVDALLNSNWNLKPKFNIDIENSNSAKRILKSKLNSEKNSKNKKSA